MPAPILMALRQRIIERYKSGEKVSSIARIFKISRGTIYSFINQEQTEGVMDSVPNMISVVKYASTRISSFFEKYVV